jgi:hypothetical protein
MSILKTFSYGETTKGNDIITIPPKTLDSARQIVIDDFVIAHLKMHRAW